MGVTRPPAPPVAAAFCGSHQQAEKYTFITELETPSHIWGHTARLPVWRENRKRHTGQELCFTGVKVGDLGVCKLTLYWWI